MFARVIMFFFEIFRRKKLRFLKASQFSRNFNIYRMKGRYTDYGTLSVNEGN